MPFSKTEVISKFCTEYFVASRKMLLPRTRRLGDLGGVQEDSDITKKTMHKEKLYSTFFQTNVFDKIVELPT